MFPVLKETLIASIKRNFLRIIPVKVRIAKIRGLLANVDSKRCLSDELIADRRKEAQIE
jgi:hypothetical protein